MLKTAKKDAITDMVRDCGRNSKKLYILVTNLAGTFKENHFPEGLFIKELAEQFAEFFITKIKKYKQDLDDKGIFRSGSNGNPTHTLSILDRFTEEEVASIIKLKPSKMYELLKEALDGLLPTLTRIVNLSLVLQPVLSHGKLLLFNHY